MALRNSSQYITTLMFLGVFALIFGLGASHVEQQFDPITAGAVAAGLFFWVLGFGLILRFNSPMARGSSLRKKIVLGAIYIGIVIVYVSLNYAAFYYNPRLDVTRFRQHTLTDFTENILKKLEKEVFVTVFYVGLPPKYLEDLLGEYERVSQRKMRWEIVDPLVKLGYAAQFGSVIRGDERRAFVRSGDDQREINFTDYMLGEEQLTNTILRLTRGERTVCFTSGHKEYQTFGAAETGLDTFVKLLASNAISAKEIFIKNEKVVPSYCDALVVAGAKDFLTGEEETIISDYLHRGGDALFLIENTVITTPDQPLTEEEMRKNPSLNNLLQDWGIHIASDVVVDLASHASGDVGSPATRNYMKHEALIKDLDYTFYVRPRTVTISAKRPPTVKAVPFVLTASDQASWGESNRTLIVKFEEGDDIPGPVAISAVVWEPKGKNKEKVSDTRFIVFTDADFLTNAYIGQFSNAQMGLNIVNWLVELDYQPFVNSDEIKIDRLDLTSRQKRIVLTILAAVCAWIIFAGILVWIRDKVQ